MAISVGGGKGGKRKVMAEINITPFTDVCLVLLIIFMVSTSFISAQKGLDIKLPSPSTNTQTDNRPQRQVTLTVAKDDTVSMNVSDGQSAGTTTTMSIAELEAALEKEVHDYKIQSVTIKAQHAVIYRSVVAVMDAVKLAGIDTMALAVEAPAGSPGSSGGTTAKSS